VDTLLKALSNQTQLEYVEIAFGGAILPDWEDNITSDMDSEEEEMLEEEAEDELEAYRHVCNHCSDVLPSMDISVQTTGG